MQVSEAIVGHHVVSQFPGDSWDDQLAFVEPAALVLFPKDRF